MADKIGHKKILGRECSLSMHVEPNEAAATVEMSGAKVRGRRIRQAKFDAAACRRMAKAFEEMTKLLDVAEVQAT